MNTRLPADQIPDTATLEAARLADLIEATLAQPQVGELGDLAMLAAELRRVAPSRISPSARARIQSALQDEVSARVAGPAAGSIIWSAFVRRWRFGLVLRVAASLAAVALALSSAVMASASSLPGDPLYGVKRWRENVELRLAAQDFERLIQLRLALADERAAEIASLSRQGRGVPVEVVTTLVDADRQLHALAGSATAATQDAIRSATSEHESALRALAATNADLAGAADDLARLNPSPEAPGSSLAPPASPTPAPTSAAVLPTSTPAARPQPTQAPLVRASATPPAAGPTESAGMPTAAPQDGSSGGGAGAGGSASTPGGPAPTSEPPTSAPADTPPPEATNPNAGERERDLQTPPPGPPTRPRRP